MNAFDSCIICKKPTLICRCLHIPNWLFQVVVGAALAILLGMLFVLLFDLAKMSYQKHQMGIQHVSATTLPISLDE
jgi:succinate dehydrogenase hydrophobic anchor subunit